MIFGVGCDLCAAARIQKSLTGAHGAAFAQKVYGAAECAALGLAQKNGAAMPPANDKFSTNFAHTVESAAANFTAKEAFLKAAGTGLSGFALGEIEALRKPSGAPYYAFSGAAAAWMKENGLTAQLSLSHENGLAMAVCILEQQEA
ncbi:MAG: holo-ACP synthase [Faecalibacterium sp.]|jgi:holo-[acyl-carrier protein] synthase|nr:holo-ACP synthase [Faecalibacterium sp.]